MAQWLSEGGYCLRGALLSGEVSQTAVDYLRSSDPAVLVYLCLSSELSDSSYSPLLPQLYSPPVFIVLFQPIVHVYKGKENTDTDADAKLQILD